MEDRSGGHGELIVANAAPEKLFIRVESNCLALATGALGAFRPAQAPEKLMALPFCGIFFPNINQGHHRTSLCESRQKPEREKNHLWRKCRRAPCLNQSSKT